jgi:hypothetical protein
MSVRATILEGIILEGIVYEHFGNGVSPVEILANGDKQRVMKEKLSHLSQNGQATKLQRI